MTAQILPLTYFVNVSVNAPAAGAGEYNTSNLALFTREVPANTFGALGYKLYTSETAVGIDFGTGSTTYAMAVAAFAQKPSILANNGKLIIIPFVAANPSVQNLAYPSAPTFGAFKLNYAGTYTIGFIDYNATAADIQTELQTIPGLGAVTVAGASPNFVVTFTGVVGLVPLLTVTNNSLQDAGANAVVPTVANAESSETLPQAITRTKGIVQYFGLMTAEIVSQVDQLAAATIVQGLNKIAFFVSYTPADIQPGGKLDLLRTSSLTQSRALYYGDVLTTALAYMASYASRALSVNFNGSNTTQTMHNKALAGMQPDPSMDETTLALAQAAGADVYGNFQGLPEVFISGANRFFDSVYNGQWFAGALQVAGFNYNAQTSTKVPQTEPGMTGLKGAYRKVCKQGVTNGYLAPGEWTSSESFGNQADLLRNVEDNGYYIFSQPIAQQQVAARQARNATLVQIAAQEAGAIHSSSVIVDINP